MGKSASKVFSEEVLRTHNDYRKTHQAPPLKLSSKLSREASRYAESLASTRILKHSADSSKGNYGENLAWASYDQSGKDVCERWYNEVQQYHFNRPGFTSGTGHFTAMVWKSSCKLGVGKAVASDGSTFVVARYTPAGNIVNQGHFETNVLPARS
ncbi:GLI pathogenesis-related 2, like [Clupea harengus]|uniref:Golgi-associated plant pathogenesis-related protein 1 n=1 Tax=Clupea harengus TaxID=7950 RepID=A0A6P3WC98_CLUHA|nr:GLI pathogenesis-related 2, like [Clupea harengus]